MFPIVANKPAADTPQASVYRCKTLPPISVIPKSHFFLLVCFGFKMSRKTQVFCFDSATFPVQIIGGVDKPVKVTQGSLKIMLFYL